MTTLFLVALLGYVAIRRRWVQDATVSGLTRLLVDVVVPARLAVGMMEGLNFETLSQTGTIMLAMLIWWAGAMLLAWIGTRLWPGGDTLQDRAVISLSAFQNGIYIPLPMILALVPPAMAAEATVYVGGAVLIMTATQWSMGIYLLQGRSESGTTPLQSLKGALNPPLLSILVGAAFALVPGFPEAARGESAPFFITVPVETARMLGIALPPLAMLVLGMMIGQIGGTGEGSRLSTRTLSITVIVRLILSPALMVLALKTGFLGWVSPLVALVLLVEAAAPPATNLSIIARRYGGDWKLIASALLVTYLIALATMPAFTAWLLAARPL